MWLRTAVGIWWAARNYLTATQGEEENQALKALLNPMDIEKRANEIIDDTSKRTGISKAGMLGKSRIQYIVRARHLAMWRMRRDLKMSFPQIGAVMERDHTTVIKGVDKVQQIFDRLSRQGKIDFEDEYSKSDAAKSK